MSRFLFVFPPAPGPLGPAAAVARELTSRGHETAWVGLLGAGEERIGGILPRDATIFSPEAGAEVVRRSRTLRGESSSLAQKWRLLWEEFLVPFARATLPHVEDAIDAFRPDALIVDRLTFSGAIAARRAKLPWATFYSSPIRWDEALRAFPRVLEWNEKLIAGIQREAGLDPSNDGLVSPHLVVVFSSPTLSGVDDPEPETHFVGPALGARRERVDFPWDRLGEGPHVYVSLGSLYSRRGERFYEVLKEAFASAPWKTIVAAPEEAGPFPDGFVSRPWVPQLELLSRVDAVVSHGGYNTVNETLAHGLPMVLLPMQDDQPEVARRVVDSGAGLRLRINRVDPPTLRDTVDRVLTEPGFRAAAERLGEELLAGGGTASAADRVEELVSTSRPERARPGSRSPQNKPS